MKTQVLIQLRDCILKRGNLCNFYGNAEAEAMIGQTVIAAANRADAGGEPFSLRGNGVTRGWQRCGTDNAAAYARLLADGMFREDTRSNSVVIFPTDALLEKLSVYFLGRAENGEP